MNKWHKSLFALIAMAFATTGWSATGTSSECKPVVCEKQEMGPFAYNYRKDLGLVCPNEFYVRGDFLLFQPQEEGLEYGFLNEGPAPILPIAGGRTLGFSSRSHEWDWNFGARVGIGAYISHDSWNLELTWTYLGLKQDDEILGRTGEVIIPYFVPASSDSTYNKASARWTGSFNTIDLSLAKPYFVSKKFIMNPFFSLRAAWIDQDFVARYTTITPTAGAYDKSINKNDFWGFGLRGGLKSEYLFSSTGASIFGCIAGSVVYGKFDVTQSLVAGSDDALNYSFNKDYYCNTPNMEVSLGASWATKFGDDKYRIALAIAYEFHYWWNQLQLMRFISDEGRIAGNINVHPNNLSLSGLSFSLQFDF